LGILSSKVIVKDEGELPDDVEAIRCIFEAPAVDTHDLLGLTHCVLQLKNLFSHVVTLGTVTQFEVLVEADKAGVVSEMTTEDMTDRLFEFKHLSFVVHAKSRGHVISAAIIESHLDRSQTTDVLPRTYLQLSQQASLKSLLSRQRQGFFWHHVFELHESLSTEWSAKDFKSVLLVCPHFVHVLAVWLL